MRLLRNALIAGLSLCAMILAAGPDTPARAQDAAALSGTVSSAEEGAMEGVLVSARHDGSNVTTTVVSDDKGHYAFPAARLAPGRYTVSIRAIGYQLDGPKSIDVAAAATADLKLSKIKRLVGQISNGEWLMSLPGADKQKAFLTQCVGCHTMQRIVSSTHDAAEFEQIFVRMGSYSPGSTPCTPQASCTATSRRITCWCAATRTATSASRWSTGSWRSSAIRRGTSARCSRTSSPAGSRRCRSRIDGRRAR